jgi:hypothetical protein
VKRLSGNLSLILFLLTAGFLPESLIKSVLPVETNANHDHISTSPAGFTFIFYNTENLFDATNDSLTDDEEFLPEGDRRWTYTRYYRKLQSVAKVILSAGDTVPPAFVGLCEVENRGVAEALVMMTPLSRYDYGILHFDSKDTRGIDLCLLYNRELASPIASRAIYPVSVEGDNLHLSRPILYAKMKIGEKTLHLLLNHWPSRRGGVLAAAAVRRGLTDYIIAFTDSIFEADGKESAVIIAGDLNCTPLDDDIKSFNGSGFVNLFSASGNGKSREGTYKYRGVWQILDHIIVSKSMMEGISDFSVEESMIHSAGFLLINDVVYPGLKPFPTFDGYRYAGGYSDHLPVKLIVKY